MNEPSYWFRAVPEERQFPELQGNIKTDVAIIGGGIAGFSSAYFLSQAGIDVVLLEAGTLGSGDSGYTTAFATRFLDDLAATVKAWDASRAGISLLEKIIIEEKIKCDWSKTATVGFTQKEDTSALRRIYETLKPLNPSLEYYEGKKAVKRATLNTRAALRTHDGEGQFHIRKFLWELARISKEKGAKIFEGSEATNIKSDIPLTVQTTQGIIETEWLIVSTGSPPRKFFPRVSKLLRGAITYVIQMEFPQDSRLNHSLFWDDQEPFHYLRWVDETNLILGGEDHPFGEKTKNKPHAALEAWLQQSLPRERYRVVNTWQGSLFYTPDFLPFIDAHPSYGEQTIFLTGFGGNGMTHGFLAGAIAADIIQKKKNAFEELFTLKRLLTNP